MAFSGQYTETRSGPEMAMKPLNLDIFGIGFHSGSHISTSDVILESNMLIPGKQAETGSGPKMVIKPHNMGIFGIGLENGSQILTPDIILEFKMVISGQLAETGSQLEMAMKHHYMGIFEIISQSQISTFDVILESNVVIGSNRK